MLNTKPHKFDIVAFQDGSNQYKYSLRKT